MAPSTALQKALTHLRQVVDRARCSSRRRLPTAKELAEEAGVSHPVVLKAVRILCDEGVLESRRGRGIELAGPRRMRLRDTAQRSSPRWRSLLVQLERAIHNGRYPPGTTLPSLKELSSEYGVSYRTLKRALESLVRHGSLKTELRGYAVQDIEGLHYRNSIVLITRGVREGDISEGSPRMHEQLRALERECSQRNLRLQTFIYDHEQTYLYPTERWREITQDPAVRDSILGFIVWPTAMSPENRDALLVRLSSLERPIAALIEGEQTEVPPVSAPHAPMRSFSIATTPVATRQVGRYLLSLGHRDIVFISPFESESWSMTRHRGLLQAYRAAGLESGVHTMTGEKSFHTRTQNTTADLYRTVGQMIATLPEGTRVTRAFRRLRWRIASLAHDEVEHEGLSFLVNEAFKAFPQATAWVGVNDYVAVECLHFLRRQGTRVPADMSVVGLDDGLDAHLYKLTSYNFNVEGIVRAMVTHVLSPTPSSTLPTTSSDRSLEFEGHVVVRETTGKARIWNGQ